LLSNNPAWNYTYGLPTLNLAPRQPPVMLLSLMMMMIEFIDQSPSLFVINPLKPNGKCIYHLF
jgi:hypothetical protein